jgi:hypothetical protein
MIMPFIFFLFWPRSWRNKEKNVKWSVTSYIDYHSPRSIYFVLYSFPRPRADNLARLESRAVAIIVHAPCILMSSRRNNHDNADYHSPRSIYFVLYSFPRPRPKKKEDEGHYHDCLIGIEGCCHNCARSMHIDVF